MKLAKGKMTIVFLHYANGLDDDERDGVQAMTEGTTDYIPELDLAVTVAGGGAVMQDDVLRMAQEGYFEP